jgi:DNA-binding IclR family transcriptional regulator
MKLTDDQIEDLVRQFRERVQRIDLSWGPSSVTLTVEQDGRSIVYVLEAESDTGRAPYLSVGYADTDSGTLAPVETEGDES